MSKTRWTIHGWLAGAVVVVPAVVAWIGMLPVEVRRSFAFQYREPTLVTAYTAHFVHLTTGHLSSNLVGYLVVVTTGYWLARQTSREEPYLVGVTATVLGLPVVLSGANLLFPRPGVTYGLSGVVMGLVALLALELFAYVDCRTGTQLGWGHAASLFFADVGLMAAAVRPRTTTTITVAAVTGVVLAAYATTAVRRIGGVSRLRSALGIEAGIAVVLLVAFPLLAFPQEPVSAGTVTNLLGHFLGFALVFIAAYVRPLVEAQLDRLATNASPE